MINIEFINQERIAVITLNRPEIRHAFNTEMAEQLLVLLKQLTQNEVRVLILTSSTDDAFCSGADLKERKDMTDEQWLAQHKLFENMFLALSNMRCPTISVLKGYALAGGFELALNTDIIIAAHNVQIGLTEVRRGIMPGGGGARLLPKRVALHVAKEWLFTGRIVDGIEANAAGLFNHYVPTNEVMNVAIELAQTIAENAPIGVSGVKKVASYHTLPQQQAFELEIQTYNEVVATEDRLEGILAFNEKRKPNFSGR